MTTARIQATAIMVIIVIQIKRLRQQPQQLKLQQLPVQQPLLQAQIPHLNLRQILPLAQLVAPVVPQQAARVVPLQAAPQAAPQAALQVALQAARQRAQPLLLQLPLLRPPPRKIREAAPAVEEDINIFN